MRLVCETVFAVIASAIPPISFAEVVPQVIALNNAIQSYASLNQHILFADWFTALQDDRGTCSC